MSENAKEQLISTPTNNCKAAEADSGDPEKDVSQPEPEANSSTDQRDSCAGMQDAQEEGRGQSTGPRTAKGKVRSSQNSRTHGLFCRDLHFDSHEEQEQFEELVEDLRQDRRPRGALQEMMVVQMAKCLWRLLLAQDRIGVEFSKRDRASWATTVHHFMGKSNALALPLPGDPQSSNSRAGEDWVPWHCKELSLKLVGGDHNVQNLHEVSGNDLQFYTDKKDTRSGSGTVERFELEMKLGDSLETFRRYESALKREFFQYIDCLERLQRRKPTHDD